MEPVSVVIKPLGGGREKKKGFVGRELIIKEGCFTQVFSSFQLLLVAFPFRLDNDNYDDECCY